ncbi:MAG: MTAP family purine nucleoside phosphorylase [Candidatus Zambryskibacteria bacterium]|nr:MTAP family purine nucleoside phosphorylase [Candidatus Zambryskibacteria bacterium]
MTGTSLGKPKLGIIGGSGMCSFPELKVISRLRPETKYGQPSDEIAICEYAGQLVAFLPRHGEKHTLAPHKVPYKANLAAFKELGVEYVLATCIVGSLKKEIVPGSLVIPDQFVNLTWGRDNLLEADGGSFIHLPMGEPYCNHLRGQVMEVASTLKTVVVPQGTVAVIQGPRFSTKAESLWLSANGWDIINMTQYPECYFARELGLCYAAIATVTDYDVGLQESLVIDPRQMGKVLEIFRGNVQKTKDFLLAFIREQVPGLSCRCASTVLKAYYERGL